MNLLFHDAPMIQMERMTHLPVFIGCILILTINSEAYRENLSTTTEGFATIQANAVSLIYAVAPFVWISACDILQVVNAEVKNSHDNYLDTAISLKCLPLLIFILPLCIVLAFEGQYGVIVTPLVTVQLLLMAHLFSFKALANDVELSRRQQMQLIKAIFLSLGFFSWRQSVMEPHCRNCTLWLSIGIISHTICGCCCIWRLLSISRAYCKSLSIVPLQHNNYELPNSDNSSSQRSYVVWNYLMVLMLIVISWMCTGLMHLMTWLLYLLFWVTILR